MELLVYHASVLDAPSRRRGGRRLSSMNKLGETRRSVERRVATQLNQCCVWTRRSLRYRQLLSAVLMYFYWWGVPLHPALFIDCQRQSPWPLTIAYSYTLLMLASTRKIFTKSHGSFQLFSWFGWELTSRPAHDSAGEETAIDRECLCMDGCKQMQLNHVDILRRYHTPHSSHPIQSAMLE